MLHKLTNSLLNLLFPDRCAGCSQIGALLCARCLKKLQPYPDNDGPIAGLDRAEVAHLFSGALRPAIHSLKYRGQRRMAIPLGDLLADHLLAKSLAATLLPVPLHISRLAERGFNQSELLAHRLSHATGLPILTEGLVRIRSTGQQASLDARKRQENMRTAFAWRSSHPPPDRILLIDDVLTTGATLAACAQALRATGSSEVSALVLARSLKKTHT